MKKLAVALSVVALILAGCSSGKYTDKIDKAVGTLTKKKRENKNRLRKVGCLGHTQDAYKVYVPLSRDLRDAPYKRTRLGLIVSSSGAVVCTCSINLVRSASGTASKGSICAAEIVQVVSS